MKFVKVGWEYTQTDNAVEKRTRGGRVYDRSGVHEDIYGKNVAKTQATDEIPNVRLYRCVL